jgi:hypothetical protein
MRLLMTDRRQQPGWSRFDGARYLRSMQTGRPAFRCIRSIRGMQMRRPRLFCVSNWRSPRKSTFPFGFPMCHRFLQRVVCLSLPIRVWPTNHRPPCCNRLSRGCSCDHIEVLNTRRVSPEDCQGLIINLKLRFNYDYHSALAEGSLLRRAMVWRLVEPAPLYATMLPHRPPARAT